MLKQHKIWVLFTSEDSHIAHVQNRLDPVFNYYYGKLICKEMRRPPLCCTYKKLKAHSGQKKCGFPVSRPYLAFGRRNPDPKLFYWIMLVSVST
jgi:hypothetical protein